MARIHPIGTGCQGTVFSDDKATVCTTADISQRMLILIACEAAQSNSIRRKPDFFTPTIILNVLGIHALLLNSGDPAPSVETVEVANLSLITRKTFVQYKLWHHLISSSNLQCFRLNKSTLFAFNYSIHCHAIHRARGQPYFRSLTLICSHQMLKTNNYGFNQILENQ
ncbi:hypothetical protein T05_12552 [Trichinella murrelli]|uniref:Uncharacterized protein n=1 Tax=Trichinella murrelli TaxID=144512 RepID=A0A0V0U8C5_9BILA|nr:hypothetical protein T05_12552 [Trichinella murrelli]